MIAAQWKQIITVLYVVFNQHCKQAHY